MIKEPNDFIIACDMDDTIEQFGSAWINWLNSHYGTTVTPEQVTSWNIASYFPEIPKAEIYSCTESEAFWDSVEPDSHAIFYLSKLQDEGFPIYIVTSAHHKTYAAKLEKCLFKYFPFIDRHNVIVTYNKQLIKCNVLVDDGTHNIEGDYYGLLMSRPHNQSYIVDNDKTYRVNNWTEVYHKIHELYNMQKNCI